LGRTRFALPWVFFEYLLPGDFPTPLFFGRLVLPLSTFSLAGAGGSPSDVFVSLIVGMAFSVKAGFFAVYSSGTKTTCAIEMKALRQLFASIIIHSYDDQAILGRFGNVTWNVFLVRVGGVHVH
jgi:hypothetical protein